MKLLEKYKLNDTLTLNNRIALAPMTRCFADDDLVPTEEIAHYYERRAEAGLIITEGTIINPMGLGYSNVPGIFTESQIKGWKLVTQKVHQQGGKIFMQIWHVGRVSHPYFLNGETPVAPSAVSLEGRIPRSKDLQYGTPRALTLDEVIQTIQDYKSAAKNAIEAGFDGVEIHGANGYLIDQFIRQQTNQRQDQYGGSTEGRASFPLQVIDAVCDTIGPQRTAIRLSPGSYINIEHTAGDEDTYQYILEKLNEKELAYVHTGIFDDSMSFDYLGGSSTGFLRKHYKGIVMASGGYTPEKSEQAIKSNQFDMISIGRPFLANPDYIKKIAEGADLTTYDASMLESLF